MTTTPDTPAHLTPNITGRGFKHMPAVEADPGETVRAYESSAAFRGPHVWLSITSPANRNEPGGVAVQAFAHMHIDKARELAEQLLFLCDNHYQI